MNPENPMCAHENDEALKQSYVRRVLDFRQIYIANKRADDHVKTVPHAILLACDLLDDYGDIGNIAKVFEDQMGDEAFSLGVFCAFDNSLSTSNRRFDQILEQLYLDHTKHFPHQLVAKTRSSMSNMECLELSFPRLWEQKQPTLWDTAGDFQHNPNHFMASLFESAEFQAREFFENNIPAFKKIAFSIPGIEAPFNAEIVSKIMVDICHNQLPINDPRRQALLPRINFAMEFNERLGFIVIWLRQENHPAEILQFIDRLFEVFELLNDSEKDDALTRLESSLSNCFIQDDAIAGSNIAVQAYSCLLNKACAKGLDALFFFAKHLGVKKNMRDIALKSASKLPPKNASSYLGESMASVICAAFLMNRDDQELLSLDLEGDALLSLYILKGNERYKDALRTPEKADRLLANELGL
ncbi:hypothetical protein RBE51_20545 [Pseudomonas taiwanensis]|uniref:hypothetical protein n=1 Tax=Pseudomonas taiwanensis TaxID=470150 RepID=UPI0028DF85A0|nr:hypothetical protein [Pseudomonas taiwanensis]MDT8925185.1 hypothetical protein [Pseudomonas taiwanensis]